MLKIKIKYFVPDMPKIEKIDIGDWIDLRIARNTSLSKWKHCLIPSWCSDEASCQI